MGYEYFKRPLRSVVGNSTLDSLTLDTSLTLPVESLTASAALQSLGTTAVVHALTQGTSGAGRDFRLPAPTAGALHFVSLNTNTTSPDNLVIFTNTTAQTFFGTTFNQIRPATGSTAAAVKGRLSALFVGVSTSQWAVLPAGTTLAWVFSASTGSTGQ